MRSSMSIAMDDYEFLLDRLIHGGLLSSIANQILCDPSIAKDNINTIEEDDPPHIVLDKLFPNKYRMTKALLRNRERGKHENNRSD